METQQHLSSVHTHEEAHHGHTHASVSHHAGGHHLLQVENLCVGFQMYETLPQQSSPAKGSARKEKQTKRFGFFSRTTTRQTMQWVIDHLSLSVHTGEILAVVGASGSGKTLLADVIMGLYDTNTCVEGVIYYDGEASNRLIR